MIDALVGDRDIVILEAVSTADDGDVTHRTFFNIVRDSRSTILDC